MSTQLAALASRYVGRRVILTTGQTATITRITGQGITVTLPGLTGADIARYLDQ